MHPFGASYTSVSIFYDEVHVLDLLDFSNLIALNTVVHQVFVVVMRLQQARLWL